jgi:hypothetical protein
MAATTDPLTKLSSSCRDFSIPLSPVSRFNAHQEHSALAERMFDVLDPNQEVCR